MKELTDEIRNDIISRVEDALSMTPQAIYCDEFGMLCIKGYASPDMKFQRYVDLASALGTDRLKFDWKVDVDKIPYLLITVKMADLWTKRVRLEVTPCE